MTNILDYVLEVNKIKDVKRYSIHSRACHESVADHSFLMTVLATKLIDELKLDLDFKKVIKMIVHHDFGEIGLTKDFVATRASADAEYANMKRIYEDTTTKNIAKRYGEEILELCNEYDAAQTREAKFVKAIDKLEATIHLMNRGAKHLDNAEFAATYALKTVRDFPELVPFLRELQSYMKPRFIAAGHSWKPEYDI